MKKLLILFALPALFLVACNKDEDVVKPEEKEITAQIASWADDWDSYAYSFNDEKQIVKIVRNNDEKTYNFEYDGNTINISGDAVYTIVIGSNGYASTFSDEWDTYNYTYDEDGYLIKVVRDGEVKSNIVIEDGCIKSWSKFSEGVELIKNHTYSTTENVAGIYNIYTEAAGFSRWLAELGFFGKPTKYLCTGNQWDYSESGSEISYEYDENGFVTKEVKNFPLDNWTENYSYTWNVIEE